MHKNAHTSKSCSQVLRRRCLLLGRGRSVCPVHCGKTADRIRMPFGIVGRTGPGMRQVVEFGDRSTGRSTFGGEFGARHCPRGPITRTCATASRRGPLAKLLWADLFIVYTVYTVTVLCLTQQWWLVIIVNSFMIFTFPSDTKKTNVNKF